jgi:hypothetical protein
MQRPLPVTWSLLEYDSRVVRDELSARPALMSSANIASWLELSELHRLRERAVARRVPSEFAPQPGSRRVAVDDVNGNDGRSGQRATTTPHRCSGPAMNGSPQGWQPPTPSSPCARKVARSGTPTGRNISTSRPALASSMLGTTTRGLLRPSRTSSIDTCTRAFKW